VQFSQGILALSTLRWQDRTWDAQQFERSPRDKQKRNLDRAHVCVAREFGVARRMRTTLVSFELPRQWCQEVLLSPFEDALRRFSSVAELIPMPTTSVRLLKARGGERGVNDRERHLPRTLARDPPKAVRMLRI
jgi:hypothetical protein